MHRVLQHLHPISPPMAQQPLVGQDLFIIEASRPPSDTPHSVGILWTSDQSDAQTSTWQHTHNHKRHTHAFHRAATRISCPSYSLHYIWWSVPSPLTSGMCWRQEFFIVTFVPSSINIFIVLGNNRKTPYIILQFAWCVLEKYACVAPYFYCVSRCNGIIAISEVIIVFL